MNDRAEKITVLAREHLGDPYVFGAWGDQCTPSLRKKYAGYNPDYKGKIYKACQVLNDGAGSCEGCKYKGRLAYDCRGFVAWLLRQVGINIDGEGATSMFNTSSNWDDRGKIYGMPDVVCAVFKRSGEKMVHMGMHIGGGEIIHCSAGVQKGRVTDSGWTDYAIPAGLYWENEVKAAEKLYALPTLRKGSKGEAVVYLQQLLNAERDGAEIDEDGIFGLATEARVEAFQREHGLTADGIVGPMTWSALEGVKEPVQDDGAENVPEESTPDEPNAWDALVQKMREATGQAEWLLSKLDELISMVDEMRKG